MTDLHSVLLEAITARQERAKAAARFGAEWIASFYSDLDEWRIRTKGGREGVADVIAHDDVMEQVAKFMAGEDPAAVLLQTTEDLWMLGQHEPDEADVARGLDPECSCGYQYHRTCPHIRSLARRYGLGVEAEGNQP